MYTFGGTNLLIRELGAVKCHQLILAKYSEPFQRKVLPVPRIVQFPIAVHCTVLCSWAVSGPSLAHTLQEMCWKGELQLTHKHQCILPLLLVLKPSNQTAITEGTAHRQTPAHRAALVQAHVCGQETCFGAISFR